MPETKIPIFGGAWNEVKTWNVASRGFITPDDLDRGVVAEGRLRSAVDRTATTNNQILAMRAGSTESSLIANRQTFAAKRAGVEEAHRSSMFAANEMKRKAIDDGTWGSESAPGGISKQSAALRASQAALMAQSVSSYYTGQENIDIEVGNAKYETSERARQVGMAANVARLSATGFARGANLQSLRNERDIAVEAARRGIEIAPDETKGEARQLLRNTVSLYNQKVVGQNAEENQFNFSLAAQTRQAVLSASGNRFGASIAGINIARNDEVFPNRGDPWISGQINGRYDAQIKEATMSENVRLHAMATATERLNAGTESMHLALGGHPLEGQLGDISADAQKQISDLQRFNYAAGKQGDDAMAADVAAIKANARGKAAAATFAWSNRGHAEQVGMGIMAGQGGLDNTRFENDPRVIAAIAKIHGGAGAEKESPDVVGPGAKATMAIEAMAKRVGGFTADLFGNAQIVDKEKAGASPSAMPAAILNDCLGQLKIIASRIMSVGLIQ